MNEQKMAKKAEKMRNLALEIDGLIEEEESYKADAKKTKKMREERESELRALAKTDPDQLDLLEDQLDYKGADPNNPAWAGAGKNED